MSKELKPKAKSNNFFKFIASYRQKIIYLLVLAFGANGLNLFVPRLIGYFIDQYSQNQQVQWWNITWVLGGLSALVVGFTVVQLAISSNLSETVGFDLRQKLSEKLSRQTNTYIVNKTSSSLLTVMTSDVDAVKGIVSQGVVAAFSAALLLIGSAVALLQINWQLALLVLTIIPMIVLTFGMIFGKIGNQFRLSQKNLEKINRVINESVVAASLVRVLNSQSSEMKKFDKVNKDSKEINLGIVRLFSTLIPIVTLLSNLATLAILYYGGIQVIEKNLSLGQFSAFLSYLAILITPIFILSFISTSLSRALISFARIDEVLQSEVVESTGTLELDIKGGVEFKNINLELNTRKILKDINFKIRPGTKTAILGPTAAGKSQVFSLLAGLSPATSGEIFIDGEKLSEITPNSFYSQVGLVFQDSVIFNASLAENILFQNDDELTAEQKQERLKKAIYTATLDDLIESLPKGLETIISERGTNLSGGQKQRLMLARALAINPKLLLLDDFTARVDTNTEKMILKRLFENYPQVTLISITQKIEPIKDYDLILLFMEGELLAQGKHDDLLQNSLEYKQIWESQQSSES